MIGSLAVVAALPAHGYVRVVVVFELQIPQRAV